MIQLCTALVNVLKEKESFTREDFIKEINIGDALVIAGSYKDSSEQDLSDKAIKEIECRYIENYEFLDEKGFDMIIEMDKFNEYCEEEFSCSAKELFGKNPITYNDYVKTFKKMNVRFLTFLGEEFDEYLQNEEFTVADIIKILL